MTRHAAKPENEVQGCDNVARLFGVAFRLAASGLDAADVAKLVRTPIGDVSGLAWIERPALDGLIALVEALAAREARRVFRLRQEERAELLALLGTDAARSARKMFVLAWVLDQGFEGQVQHLEHGGAVARVPARFLEGIDNAPPPIGQMTPLAACRRWMRSFWYVGHARNLEAFGTPLRPVPRRLSERARQSLQRANDDDELVVSLVGFRRHAGVDLAMLAAREGCFAVGGAGPPATEAELKKVLDVLHEQRAHVAIFPEMAMTPAAFDLLRSLLAARRARFPALLVIGLTHVRRGDTFANEARVLDAHGQELLSHSKIEPFTLPEGKLLEDIVPRADDSYAFLDTPVGRLVVNVCRDFRSDMPMFLNRLLAPTLIAVPAYSQRLDFVAEEARHLGARQGAIVGAVNPPAAELRDIAVFSAPIRSGPKPATAKPNWTDPAHFAMVHAFRLRRGAVGVEDALPVVAV